MTINTINFFTVVILLISFPFFSETLAVRDPRQLIQYYQTTRYTLSNRPLFTVETAKLPQLETSANVNQRKAFRDDSSSTATAAVTRLEEGSFCRRSFDGRSGYCIVAFQCLHVIREFRLHGTKVDVCTHRKKIPIVCCPLEEKDVEDENSKRISARKCEQYNEAIRHVKMTKITSFSGKKCSSSVPMIVGGEQTQSGQYPHMAAVGWTSDEDDEDDVKWGCGGSLISEFFVITAAHCTESGGIPPDIVRLGAHELNSPTSFTRDVKISKITTHPEYRASSYYHDIALLKLSEKVQFSQHIRPSCLWQFPHLTVPEAIATGWGRTEFLGPRSERLQKVDLKIIDSEICKNLYKNERKLPKGIIDGQFCAGHLEGGKDTCQGDSGGPIHAAVPELNCAHFVIGITSFGKFCAAPNAPGVYTRIYSYLDWIEKHVFV